MLTPADLVRREVYYCVSSLIHTLASTDGPLAEQAQALFAPLEDWESAAMDEGWYAVTEAPDGSDPGVDCLWNDDQERSCPADAWGTACEISGVEPHGREILEHWIVSDWLADRLEEAGERIDRDFEGLTIWGRTVTGQAISMDSAIQAICATVNRGV